jgi:hypothetical protein
MSNSEPERSDRKLAWRVTPFCDAIGISRTSFYELVKQNKIKTVVIAGRRLIPDSEAQRLLTEAA